MLWYGHEQPFKPHRWYPTDESIPQWLMDYNQDTVFAHNLDNIISESGFYLGAQNDFEIRDGLFCRNWVYSSWWGSSPDLPVIGDDYECIVNQTILPAQDFQVADGYCRYIDACMDLFGEYPDHDDLALVRGLTGSQEHSVNFLVYERRKNINFSRIPFKPLRKSLLIVQGLEGIFLYKLLYNRNRRCKFYLKKRGLGVGFGGAPQGDIFSDHDQMRGMLTQAFHRSMPRYFINSNAHTDNEAGDLYADQHLAPNFLTENYLFRAQTEPFIDPYDPNMVLFLYRQKNGRANGI